MDPLTLLLLAGAGYFLIRKRKSVGVTGLPGGTAPEGGFVISEEADQGPVSGVGGYTGPPFGTTSLQPRSTVQPIGRISTGVTRPAVSAPVPSAPVPLADIPFDPGASIGSV